MARMLMILMVVMLVPVTASAQPSPTAPTAGARGIETLAWMAGSWGGEQGGLRMEEHWTAPGGGLMLGSHRDVKAAGGAYFEVLRIEARADGIYYVASPMGKGATPFKMIESSSRRVVFENPEHDFPRRILYWLDGGALHARVEGDPGGKERAEEWSWPPLPCAGAAR